MIDTPLGPVSVVVDGDAVVAVDFDARRSPGTSRHDAAPGVGGPRRRGSGSGEQPPVGDATARRSPDPATALHIEAERQLRAYFEKRLTRFDLPLRFEGTPFMREVWQALLDIPYGTTTSYGALASVLGAKSARAVGTANGRNPIAIVVPCHRVIGADGSLTGYGGGLDKKLALLVHEGAILA